MSLRQPFLLLLIAFFTIAAIADQDALAQSDSNEQAKLSSSQLSFTRDIRPILSKHCYACHGPDADHREADLRLDKDTGVDFEEVIRRIESEDADEVMPPPSTNKPLNVEQKTAIQAWVQDGANYETHWAFVPPQQIKTPVDQHPIDYFVDRKLTQHRSKRSAAAEPAVLLRRVYLDLIGLPPTPEEARAFLAEPTPEHYEKIVDQLLASPRYGERWARRWLDLARYADTNGYEKDRDRSIWPFRDWVIRAINQDMSFDQFTVEQIAGDLIENASADQLIATGFHRNTMLNEEGGVDPLEFRYYAMVDRVATTGTTWLGLTLGCAQCHTHKFDPVTHQDYFAMMAYLNNTEEPDLRIAPENAKTIRDKNLALAKQKLSSIRKHWPQPSPAETKSDAEKPRGQSYVGQDTYEQAFAQWRLRLQKNDAQWVPVQPTSMSSNQPYLEQESNGVIFVGGDTTKHDVLTIKFIARESFDTLRIEALPDPRLPSGGPGMTFYEGRKGDFFLSELELRKANADPKNLQSAAKNASRETASPKLKIESAFHSFAANQFGKNPVSAALAVDGDIQTGWSIAGRTNEPHAAVFNLSKPVQQGDQLELKMHFGRHFASTLGKFRVLVTQRDDRPLEAIMIDRALLDQLGIDGEDARTEAAFVLQAQPLAKQAAEIKRLALSAPGPTTLVMKERPADQPRSTWLRHRGEYTQPKHKVNPGLPESIRPSQLPKNRMEFAKWLVSNENPLTARVIVNRHWSAFFGTGLVKTVDDFGMQGDLPSHPQLLDYLAVEFTNNRWSVKSLHRLIVTSQTYQQTSVVTPDHSTDRHQLLNRFPRHRLEAEIIRDSALAAAGLLSTKMYGPPVRPPQPEGAAANYSKSKWNPSRGEDRYRRSVYTYQKRTAPFEMFTTFDASSGESCIARRDKSNTPLQALTLMNDPMFLEIAEALGNRISAAKGTLPDKITFGFQCLLTRSPSKEELAMLVSFQKLHNDWTATARAMICLDEAITKN